MSSQLTRLQRNHLLLSPLLLAPPCKGHGAASATRPPASRSELNRPEKNIKLHSRSSSSFSVASASPSSPSIPVASPLQFTVGYTVGDLENQVYQLGKVKDYGFNFSRAQTCLINQTTLLQKIHQSYTSFLKFKITNQSNQKNLVFYPHAPAGFALWRTNLTFTIKKCVSNNKCSSV